MRILFTTHTPPSHFIPMQPLAVAARAAGHDVAVATGASLQAAIEQAGLEYYRAGVGMDDPAVLAAFSQLRTLQPGDHLQFAMANVFAGTLADKMVPDLTRVFEVFRPDCVVSEITEPSGLLMAEARGLPAACVPFGFATVLQTFQHGLTSERLFALRKQLGLSTHDSGACYQRALLMLFASRSYQRTGSALPPHVGFYRPETVTASEGQAPAWLSKLSGRPLVYGTLGTVPHFNGKPGLMRAVIDAIGSCDVHGVVTCGHNHDPADFGPLPSNVRVERFIPQALLLERASAMIGHGGYGTTQGALHFGVPMVITPVGADQPMHAQRCQELGLARAIMPELQNAEAIRAALNEVLSEPSYRENARAQQRELAGLPDVRQAVDDLARFCREVRA